MKPVPNRMRSTRIPNPNVAQGEVDPRQPDGGKWPTTAPERHSGQAGQQQGQHPRQPGTGGEMGERARPHRGEGGRGTTRSAPDVHTSRPSDTKTSTSVRPLV